MGSAATVPSSFQTVLDGLRALPVRPEISLAESPAPARLAPFALALTAEACDGPDGDELAAGRLVVLHDPAGVDEWAGTFRLVAFVRAHLEPDLIEDPMLHDVAWAWLEESLADVAYVNLGGTVTVTASRSFGELRDRGSEGTVEIRASWTPVDTDAGAASVCDHASSWLDLLAHSAGLPPLPDGIVPLRRSR